MFREKHTVLYSVMTHLPQTQRDLVGSACSYRGIRFLSAGFLEKFFLIKCADDIN